MHYWADLQPLHGLRCYGNVTRTPNVSECVLLLALCAQFKRASFLQLKCQLFFFELATNQKFDIGIMLVILLNMATMSIEHYDEPQRLIDDVTTTSRSVSASLRRTADVTTTSLRRAAGVTTTSRSVTTTSLRRAAASHRRRH